MAAGVVTFIAALAIGLGSGAASAGTAYSDYGYFTVNGVQYQNRARVNTNAVGHFAQARTDTGKVGGSTPAGYAGSRGRLFIPVTVLWCEGINTYNTAGTEAWGQSCIVTDTISSWYSYGVSLGWNGGGYNSVYTFMSPYQSS